MSEVDRSRLPIRRKTFEGVINRTLDGSQPDWNLIGHPTPPEGAPNVLLVLIDDAGFGNPSTFGGPIQTPNYTRIADGGVRYNRFHVTALCSPTRRRCSPGGTTMQSDSGRSASSRAASRATPRRSLAIARRCLGSSATTVTAPPRSANGT